MENDLLICKEAVVSKFVKVQQSTLVHLHLQPFLTRSQLDNGFDYAWFNRSHFHELLSLLRHHLEWKVQEDAQEAQDNGQQKKKANSKESNEIILTGTSIRAACIFKPASEDSLYLVKYSSSGGFGERKECETSRSSSNLQHIPHYPQKLVCYICPRVKSSMLNLSQIVSTPQSNEHEDISKYFVAAGGS